MIYLIDVREKDELNKKYLKSYDQNKKVINIPTSLIDNFVDQITQLSQNGGNIYLFCRSGNRSSTIKQKYFKHINNIISSGTVEDTARIHSLELIKL